MAKELSKEERVICGAYRKLFLCPEGKRVLEHLKTRYGVTTANIPSLGQVDPIKVVFLEAQRMVVLNIMARVYSEGDS